PATYAPASAETNAGPTQGPAAKAPTAAPATATAMRCTGRTPAAYDAPSPSSVATGRTPNRSTAAVLARAWAAGTTANAAHPPRVARAATRTRSESTRAHTPYVPWVGSLRMRFASVEFHA